MSGFFFWGGGGGGIQWESMGSSVVLNLTDFPFMGKTV